MRKIIGKTSLGLFTVVTVSLVLNIFLFQSTGFLRFDALKQKGSGVTCAVKLNDVEQVFDRRKAARMAAMKNASKPGAKYSYDLFEPDAVCLLEERFGSVSGERHQAFGDGPKFVCGVDYLSTKDDCLVYSIGSNNKVEFERSVKEFIGCEVHTFDPTLQTDFVGSDYAVFHPWGLGKDGQQMSFMYGNFTAMSLEHMMKDLGHTNRTIDIFKIDCEGCEYEAMAPVFDAIATGKLSIDQILIEIHGTYLPKILSFFEGADKAGYRITHKERNGWGCDGYRCLEYALVQPRFLREALAAAIC